MLAKKINRRVIHRKQHKGPILVNFVEAIQTQMEKINPTSTTTASNIAADLEHKLKEATASAAKNMYKPKSDSLLHVLQAKTQKAIFEKQKAEETQRAKAFELALKREEEFQRLAKHMLTNAVYPALHNAAENGYRMCKILDQVMFIAECDTNSLETVEEPKYTTIPSLAVNPDICTCPGTINKILRRAELIIYQTLVDQGLGVWIEERIERSAKRRWYEMYASWDDK